MEYNRIPLHELTLPTLVYEAADLARKRLLPVDESTYVNILGTVIDRCVNQQPSFLSEDAALEGMLKSVKGDKELNASRLDRLQSLLRPYWLETKTQIKEIDAILERGLAERLDAVMVSHGFIGNFPAYFKKRGSTGRAVCFSINSRVSPQLDHHRVILSSLNVCVCRRNTADCQCLNKTDLGKVGEINLACKQDKLMAEKMDELVGLVLVALRKSLYLAITKDEFERYHVRYSKLFWPVQSAQLVGLAALVAAAIYFPCYYLLLYMRYGETPNAIERVLFAIVGVLIGLDVVRRRWQTRR